LYLKPTDNILGKRTQLTASIWDTHKFMWCYLSRFVCFFEVVGCGNSRLSEDLYDDGYEKITNIDTCKLVRKFQGRVRVQDSCLVATQVIMMMREKYRDRPTMKWEVKDICDIVLDTVRTW
jgi:hypothetical protein